jgi:hypothetical protein
MILPHDAGRCLVKGQNRRFARAVNSHGFEKRDHQTIQRLSVNSRRQEVVEILSLPFHWRTTAEFIKEVSQEDDVVLLLRPASLGWHQRHDALAIGGEIDVLSGIDRVRHLLLRPQLGLARDKGIALSAQSER